jgi:outer membrane immunogenic protein
MHKFAIALLSTTAVCAILVGPVAAADLPAKAPVVKAPVMMAPAFSWSGLYIGAFGGYGWGDHDRTNVNDFANSYDSSGGLFGGVIGYNWQFGSWVLGAEGDIAWAGIKGDDNWVGGSKDETKFEWLSTIRARVGYALADRWLVYGTGGVAFADIKHTNYDTVTDSASWTKTGWTAGVGLEYAMVGNWSARLDYRYYDFGSYTRTPGNGNATFTVDNTLQTVTVGLSYRFGASPVVAKY